VNLELGTGDGFDVADVLAAQALDTVDLERLLVDGNKSPEV
jgi:hypothetical protein